MEKFPVKSLAGYFLSVGNATAGKHLENSFCSAPPSVTLTDPQRVMLAVPQMYTRHAATEKQAACGALLRGMYQPTMPWLPCPRSSLQGSTFQDKTWWGEEVMEGVHLDRPERCYVLLQVLECYLCATIFWTGSFTQSCSLLLVFKNPQDIV